MSRTLCIYHGNCADGFTAAWVVRGALGVGVEFIPGVYGEDPPDVTGADVILVDFSYKRPVLDGLAAKARSVLVLDHHKTAQAELDGFGVDLSTWSPPFGWDRYMLDVTQDGYEGAAGTPYRLFDMERSGAQLAWDFFNGGPRPRLVDYVGDRDLWRFTLTGSREVAAVIFSHPYDFDTWHDLAAGVEDDSDLAAMIREGKAIERKHHKDIAELLKVTRREMVIGGVRVPVANLPYTMSSDAAGLMAQEAPFAACYYDRNDGLRVFSLRSRGEGGADVSAIAAAYGGGGHRNAAGFQMPIGWEGEP